MTDDELSTSLENIGQLLKDNHSFKVGDLTLGFIDNRKLTVIGWTNFVSLKNLTKKQALIELNEIKDLFRLMLKSSKQLADFAESKTIKYILNYDDAGKCGIEICSEENARTSWQVQLRQE
jgi:hypothetical protein